MTDFLKALNEAIDARKAYEQAKSSDNDSIQACLNDIRKSVQHDSIVAILVASNVDANFINRQERKSARFNVYSAVKVANIARALASAESLNHYTRAIFATCVALERAELKLTHKDAASACSQDCKLSDKTREKIIARTRYAKHIAANTASTQSSSSINALLQFNVLSESRDNEANAVYTLNRDAHATRAIADLLKIEL